MLAKLINGQISFAPKKLYVNGRLVTNPSSNLLESLGYKQVIESEMPNEAVPGMLYVSIWAETEKGIEQIYALVDEPKKQKWELALELVEKQINSIPVSEEESLYYADLYPEWSDLCKANGGKGYTAEKSSFIFKYTSLNEDGTFEELYIGDYWTINGVNWRIAAFDYFYNCGDTAFAKHHVVVVPDTSLYTYAMNNTDTTAGGYDGSQMYTQGLSQAKTAINSAFGSSHILSHRIYLTNSTTNGYASGGAWADSTVDLMCEHMAYGSGIFSPVSDGTDIPNNYRVEKGQLPLFIYEPFRISSGNSWWLRDVITSSNFASVDGNGRANTNAASGNLGVRPSFCIGI